MTLDQEGSPRKLSHVFVCQWRQQRGDADAEHERDDGDESIWHVASSRLVVRQHLPRDGQPELLKLDGQGVLSVVSTRAERSQAQANFGEDRIHTRMLARRFTFGSSPVVWFSVVD